MRRLANVGTPRTELVKLERQILAIGATEDVRTNMYKPGMLLTVKGSAEFKEALVKDPTLNRDLIRNIGLKLNQASDFRSAYAPADEGRLWEGLVTDCRWPGLPVRTRAR